MFRIPQAVRQLRRQLVDPPSRSDQTELLDEAILDPAELAENLRDIRRVNQLLGGTSTVLRHLPRLLTAVPAQADVTVLDLATGSADIPLAIDRWATRRGRRVVIVASDFSDAILAEAGKQIAGHPNITLARYDARQVPLPDRQFDLVLCSLSLHHFPPDDAVRVLREMDRLSGIGFILNDLRRSRLGYVAAWGAARLTTRNRLTRNDAPLSVRRAYTVPELKGLLRRAGIDDASVSSHLWFRMAAIRGARDYHA